MSTGKTISEIVYDCRYSVTQTFSVIFFFNVSGHLTLSSTAFHA